MPNVDRGRSGVRSYLERLYRDETRHGGGPQPPHPSDYRISSWQTPEPPGVAKRSFALGIALAGIIAGILLAAPVVWGHVADWTQQTAARMFPPPAAYSYGPAHERAGSVTRAIPGMHAEKSVITGIVDPLSLSAVYYWTFALKNDTSTAHEAQFEIALPRGAAVTRATLWINGTPQEAAFSSTQQVTNAYEWITVRHRDPLLVTETAPGRILVKASPVQPGGQPMQLRIGITAPMALASEDRARVMLPHVVASNTAIDCRQDVHIEAPAAMESSSPAARTSPSEGSGSVLRANVDVTALNDMVITAARTLSPRRYATRATHSSPPAFIVADLEPNPESGLWLPHFIRSTGRPACLVIHDEDAAHRLSTLWACQEIDKLYWRGYTHQAVELAHAYRVVSPVSGATVLETEGDYEVNNLDRDMGRTVPAGSTPTLQGATTGTILPQAANTGTIVPQGGDASVLQGVVAGGRLRVNNLADLEATARQFAGIPVAVDWLTASARDANCFGCTEPAVFGLTDNPLVALILVMALAVWSFAGPAVLLVEAVRRHIGKQPGASRALMFAACWFWIALMASLVSQMLFVALAASILCNGRRDRSQVPAAAPGRAAV